MNKALQSRLLEFVKEEEHVDSNDVLNRLRDMAAGDTLYWQFDPAKRQAINDFINEVKSWMLKEMLTGNYGAEIVLDTILILCLEVGYKLKGLEV